MKTTAKIVEILRNYKARSAEKYGIETLGLFGSVARGEQNEKSNLVGQLPEAAIAKYSRGFPVNGER